MIFKALATGLLTIITVIAGYIGYNQPNLGATVPVSVAVFETTLASKLTSTATTTTLVSGTDKSGDGLNGYMCFTIDGGKTNEEFVCGDATSTTINNLIRGIDPVDGDLEVAALKKEHRAGANVKITDYPTLAIISRIINGDETFPNKISYATDSITSFTGDADIPNKLYVDTVATSGAANASYSTAGILTLATTSQFINGIGTTTVTKFLVPNTGFFNTTSAAYKGVVADASGKIKQGWLNLAEDFAFTGSNTYNTTTFNKMATFNGSTTVATPTSPTMIANKGYVDDMVFVVYGTSASLRTQNWSNNSTTATSSGFGQVPTVKLKEITINEAVSNLYLSYDIGLSGASAGEYAIARLFKNGSMIGGECSTDTAYLTFPYTCWETTSALVAGDKIQIYGYPSSTSAGRYIMAGNFNLYYDYKISGFQTSYGDLYFTTTDYMTTTRVLNTTNGI